MPADTGGSSGTRTTKSSGIGASLGRSAGRVASTTNKSGRRRSTKNSGGSSSRGYSSSRRRSSGGGGGSSRGSGGGGGGGSYTPKKPSAPSLAAYLGTDSAYQNALRGRDRSLADFLSETGRRRGEATTQFNNTKSSMERDRTTQLDAIRQEFASRGLIQSGLFGEEQGKFQQTFAEQLNALQQQQTALLADLLGQERNARREGDLTAEQARQEAIARRSAKYGL